MSVVQRHLPVTGFHTYVAALLSTIIGMYVPTVPEHGSDSNRFHFFRCSKVNLHRTACEPPLIKLLLYMRVTVATLTFLCLVVLIMCIDANGWYCRVPKRNRTCSVGSTYFLCKTWSLCYLLSLCKSLLQDFAYIVILHGRLCNKIFF